MADILEDAQQKTFLLLLFSLYVLLVSLCIIVDL
jgi:hypothetical protein